MAASELNNRLDYLISYSSQLVFVCSDKIQQQSQVVESFLAHQDEQADLALLTANELTPLVTYREKLFRQLVSQSQIADFNRPLNQLLAPLNKHDGPILISVFQGEKLPNKLVKELWDLVLQSRFANNKQHLNVLIMGLSEWAETAKSGLGAKSKDQPIVLNSQSDVQYDHREDDSEDTHEFSDLESLIQDKRKKFAQRIQDRQNPPYVSNSLYRKWWIATLCVLVFLGIFGGMLSWQYPEKAKAMLSYVGVQLSAPEQSVKQSDVITLAEPIPTEITKAEVSKVELSEMKTNEALTVTKNEPVIKKNSTKELLVTDWSTASAKLEQQSNKIRLDTSNIDDQVNVQTNLSSEPVSPLLIEDLKAQTDTVNDYQVEDKFEFEVKPIAKQQVVKFGESEPIAEQQVIKLDKVEALQTNGFLNPEPDMLLALPDEGFVIQITAMANISLLQYYIRNEQLSQQLWLYRTQRYGGDWYVLLKNAQFTSKEAARAQISNLPDTMLRNTPFIKSIRQVKQEISVSGP